MDAAVMSSSELYWQAFVSRGEYYIERKGFTALKKEHPPQRSPGLIDRVINQARP